MNEQAETLVPQPPSLPQGQAPVSPVPAASPETDKAVVAEAIDAKKEQDPEFASKFAALTRKQKELFFKEQELKRQSEKYSKYDALEKLKAEDPYKFVKEHGLDMDRLIQNFAKDGQPLSADDRVEALEKKIAEHEKRMAEEAEAARLKQEQQSVDNFKQDINNFIKSDPDKYELIHLEDAFGTVFEVIEEHFLKTKTDTSPGEILDKAKAADMVEEFLHQKALRYAQAKKLGFKTSAPSEAATAPDAESGKDQSKDRDVTLNAAMTAATPPPRPTNESREEMIKRLDAEWKAKYKR